MPKWVSAWLIPLALLWPLLWPSAARAAPPDPNSQPNSKGTAAPKMSTVRTIDDALALEPGASCLDRKTLLTQIRTWRGKDRVDQRVAVRVRGSSEDPRAVNFVVWVADEVAVERSFDLDPSDCANVHAVVSLAVAIALDDSLPIELGIIDAPAPVEQVAPGDGDVPNFDDPPLPPPRRRTVLALSFAGATFVGVTPRLSGGGMLSFDVRPRDHLDIRIGALATHLPGYALDVGEVDVTLAAGRFDLCWGSAPRRVRARLCGGLAGGAMLSAGRDFTTNYRGTTPWFAALVGADLALHVIGPLAVEIRLDGVVPLQRTELQVRDDGQLVARENLSPIGLMVALGPRFEF